MGTTTGCKQNNGTRVISSTPRVSNSTGKLLSKNSVEFSFSTKMENKFSVEFSLLIVDEFILSYFSKPDRYFVCIL